MQKIPKINIFANPLRSEPPLPPSSLLRALRNKLKVAITLKIGVPVEA